MKRRNPFLKAFMTSIGVSAVVLFSVLVEASGDYMQAVSAFVLSFIIWSLAFLYEEKGYRQGLADARKDYM